MEVALTEGLQKMKERNVERHKGDIQHDPSNTHFAIFFFFQQYRNTKLEKGVTPEHWGENGFTFADTDFTPTVKNKCPI